jgi:Ca2+-binding EF-hand superfamily protein
MKEIISVEREIEAAKLSLSVRTDFNSMDAFRMFDINGKGWVNTLEVQIGLERMGVFADRQDLKCFFKRYDRDNDGRLRYSEFCDAFAPLEQEFADRFNSRKPFYIYNKYHTDDYFLLETRKDFVNCWKLHLSSENYSESLRLKLNNRPYFNVHDAFRSVDSLNSGRITLNDVRCLLLFLQIYSLLKNHGFSATELELTYLMARFDKNKNGQITYSEVSGFF